MSWVCWVLEQNWWQGIAGIAQIVAGVLAMWTVRQSRKAIRQADEERKRSVRPDWHYTGGTDHPAKDSLIRTGIKLTNVGRGPAWHPEVAYKPCNENQVHSIRGRPAGDKPGAVVYQKSPYNIDVCWYVDRPLDGLLIVDCETQLGECLQNTYHLKTCPNPKGISRRKVTRIGRVPSVIKLPRRWPWQRRERAP